MDKSQSRNKGVKTQNKSDSGLPLQDESGILPKLSYICLLLLDILVMQIKMLFVFVESLYNLMVPAPLEDVNQQIILITGTGHGMGRELALQYAALGGIVVCVDINQQNNEQTVKDIKAQGGKAHAYVCDVSSREAIQQLAARVQKEVGEVTILVNNAGIMPCHSLLTHTEKEIRIMYDINVFAHFWLIQEFLPSMITRNRGHVVALSSMAGVLGVSNLVPYCGAKFAVRGLMEALMEELRGDSRGLAIKTTVIYPYMIDTGLCHKPRIRFPGLMGMVSPVEAARQIIQAQRQGRLEASVPGTLKTINDFVRIMPVKIGILLKDFLDSGVEAHDLPKEK